MSSERIGSSEPQNPTLNLENSQMEGLPEHSSAGLKIALVVLLLVAGIAAGYGWVQHTASRQWALERAELRASLAQAQSQADALASKVSALSAAESQEEAALAQAQAQAVKSTPAPPRTNAAPRRATHRPISRSAPPDDPRWKQVQTQLSDQQKALEESQKEIADTQARLAQTKSDLEGNLQSARTELGADIARNHTELVALEKKGERNYYEFSLEKSPAFHPTGPISIALRKADAKHEYCDLQMVVDDKEMTRKHINLYESVTLYPEGYSQALEVVINHIDKDAVRGYVSEPKVKQAPAPTSASVTPPAPAGPDLKLDHRPVDGH